MLAFSDIDRQFDLYVATEKREAEARGMARGEAKGILLTLINLVKDNLLSLPQAAKRANMTEDEFKEKAGLV